MEILKTVANFQISWENCKFMSFLLFLTFDAVDEENS